MFEELADDYGFDYSQAKPNRFAAEMRADSLRIIYEPEVTEALLETMPPAIRPTKDPP